MRLLPVLSTLSVCLFKIEAAGLDDNETQQQSPEASLWARETDDSLNMLSRLKNCDDCKNILSMAKELVKNDDKAIVAIARDLCMSSGKYDEQFCQGVAEVEGPPLTSIVKNLETDSAPTAQFCRSFVGLCDAPGIDHWSVEFASKKPSSPANRNSFSNKKPIQVIHYSDIHIDPLYEVGSSTKCSKPSCCRSYYEEDKPGKTKHPAGPYGDHACDTPISLEKSMYDFIKKTFPNAAFSLFTGDIIDHGIWNTSQPYNENLIKHSYETMTGGVDLVYGTPGNHEAHPSNIFEPKSVGNQTQWLYDSLSKEWSRWIENSSMEDAKAIGAYSTKYPQGNLRIISLNTNMYYRLNFALYRKQFERDPNSQIAWLANELDAAEKAGENVYIIGHMPMGEADALPNGSNYFDQIVNRYSGTIRAMFFGHTHLDHFEISYSNYTERTHDTAVAISYICPSLTPTSGMPSFKVYDVDPDTFAIVDAKTYIADMEDSSFQTIGPSWKQYYSARETYDKTTDTRLTHPMAELSPSWWHNVTVGFEKNQTAFDAYMGRKSRGWKTGKQCADKCRETEICALRAGRSQDNCWVPHPGSHAYKRDELEHNSHNKHDECGSSFVGDIMGMLLERVDILETYQARFLVKAATT
ncbi:Sphingomyelin phosphodiesterase [Metarhizium rileyi]|uniref:Sphingomyelin phosphodiesterase n=1 Tax=Metarhizium rileyi (strain RCEF 4871) TaxID=1649241 RepID=A0A167IV75_METRR|nr:Sphingomyelin phosphodiesterase [Metarhizium rileyi RCEF 4871]